MNEPTNSAMAANVSRKMLKKLEAVLDLASAARR